LSATWREKRWTGGEAWPATREARARFEGEIWRLETTDANVRPGEKKVRLLAKNTMFST
jgi:hypothetical protein